MTEHTNTPELRFPEFKDEWKLQKLGNLAQFSKGKSLSKKDLNINGKPCILYGELYTKYGAILNKVYSKTSTQNDSLVFSKRNQILIPSSGETDIDIATATAIDTDVKIAIGGDLNIITPINSDGRFISLYINGKGKYNLAKYAQGKSVVHLYNSDIKKLNFYLPTNMAEQKKIGDFFSKLDRQIELEEEKLEHIEAQKKGYMQTIFSQELRFKDENGNNYSNWEKVKFNYFMSKPNKLEKGKDIQKDQLLTVKLQGNGVCKANINRALKLGSTVYYKRFTGQFIYGKQNFFNGAFGIVPDDLNCFYSSGDVPALNLDNNKITNDYFINYISRKDYYKKKEAFSTGTGSKRIHENTLLEFDIMLPSIEEQNKIGNFFNKLHELIEIQSSKVELLKERKKGLLQKMFV